MYPNALYFERREWFESIVRVNEWGKNLLLFYSRKDYLSNGVLSFQSQGPNVLLIQTGDFIFGVYVNQTILPTDDKWSGSPSCFIFSITFDLKLPYHGRNPPGKGLHDYPCAFFGGEDHIQFGNGDIKLDGELETGSSQLEGCFGLGLPKTSHAASSLLAGVKDFAIDKLEVWQISSLV